MPGKVIFKVLSGASAGKEFTYDGKEQLFVGRHEDCGILLPDKLVSRRHCMMEITPPEVKVRDFGSLNGTFLNGKKIGQRDKDLNPEDVEHIQYQEFDLADGDVLGISRQCEIGVKIVEFQRCAQCGKEIDGQTVDGEDNNICADCQNDPLKLLAAILAQLGAKPGGKQTEPPGVMPVVIAGFKPIQRLGAGGMGEVWQVVEESTGKRYALKTMLQQRGADEYAKLSFLRESAMGEALRHKNIIRVYKTGYESGVFYILMELCTGGNADDYRKRAGGKLPLDVATYIILQALDGLDYAHNADILVECAGKKISTRGVVHRDFKPGNVFLADDSAYPEVRVADFGLAKAFETAGLSQNTRTGIAAGTPVFQPRAQIRNYKYSQPDVDVWAAAACYYYLLTGQFVKDLGGGDVWMAMYERDAVPIRQRDKNIPPTLAAVIDEVLAERANTGIKTAKEFKTEIVKALPAEIKTKVLQVI